MTRRNRLPLGPAMARPAALVLSPLAFALTVGAYADPGTRAIDREARLPAEDSALLIDTPPQPPLAGLLRSPGA